MTTRLKDSPTSCSPSPLPPSDAAVLIWRRHAAEFGRPLEYINLDYDELSSIAR